MPSDLVVWLTAGDPSIGWDLENHPFNSISQVRYSLERLGGRVCYNRVVPWFPVWSAKMYTENIYRLFKRGGYDLGVVL